MLRIVPHTVSRVGRSYEHFPDGFSLHLLRLQGQFTLDCPPTHFTLYFSPAECEYEPGMGPPQVVIPKSSPEAGPSRIRAHTELMYSRARTTERKTVPSGDVSRKAFFKNLPIQRGWVSKKRFTLRTGWRGSAASAAFFVGLSVSEAVLAESFLAAAVLEAAFVALSVAAAVLKAPLAATAFFPASLVAAAVLAAPLAAAPFVALSPAVCVALSPAAAVLAASFLAAAVLAASFAFEALSAAAAV
ncbi:hypothetical protein T484DRAFT_2532569 [Baffinella frigidus]|nr:hypothetical protein T484DRAFT_2532569 [Cryptophyta sp. CCMP2293]